MTEIEVTRLIKGGGPLTKKLHLKGGVLANDSSQCRMSRGRAERVLLADWRAFGPFVEATPPDGAWALGRLRDGIPDATRIVVKKDPQSARPGFAARTQDNFHYRPGAPALGLIDHDTKGMPPRVKARIVELGGVEAALAAVCPEIAGAGYIRRRSTSACVFNAETGEEYASDGLHVFLLVADGADVERFLYALHDRAWLCGLGWHWVGKAGQLLERSIVDRSVYAPERLVFEAPPDLEPPLTQREREATVHDGPPLDTGTACPDLTPAEKLELARLKAASANQLRPEAAKAKAEFIAEKTTELVKRGVPEARARAAAEAWGKETLRPDAVLEFADREIGVKTVADVLADPDRFIGEDLADPIEGVDYGRTCAVVLRRYDDGGLEIKSYAHGGAYHRLVHDAASIAAAITSAPEEEGARILAKLITQAEVGLDEEEWLKKLAGKRAKVRADVARKMVAEARAAQQEATAPTRFRGPRDAAAGAVVDGIEKRITTLEELNDRFALLQAKGKPSVYISRADHMPITQDDLRRRLANEAVLTGVKKNGEPIYVPAYKFFTEHARRHVYRRIAFTGKPVPPDTLNLFKGLGVEPCEGCCDLILAHIRDVICSGDAVASDAMLDLMAWQMQNVGQPCRVVVIMKSTAHQAGKGILLGKTLAPIYGSSGFVPAQVEQVLGRFNDALIGCVYVFLDELLFAGDRRAANAIKSLSTTEIHGIETKGLPIVQYPIGVNLWAATNHDVPAFLEERDLRYWIVEVSESRVDDTAYFAALLKEIENGGREAFAHYLLRRDVSNFVPMRDVPNDNAAKLEIIKGSINPYDARKWLEQCCNNRQLIGCVAPAQIYDPYPGDNAQMGRPIEGGGAIVPSAPDQKWREWIEGEEHPFYVFANAYTVWQQSVRSPVKPEPTPFGSLGEVLTSAGFGVRRSYKGSMRTLPDPDVCLANLYQSHRTGKNP